MLRIPHTYTFMELLNTATQKELLQGFPEPYSDDDDNDYDDDKTRTQNHVDDENDEKDEKDENDENDDAQAQQQQIINIFLAKCNFPKCQCKKPTFTQKDRNHYLKQKDKCMFNSPEEEHTWALTQTKTCSKCHKTKKLVCFNKNTSSTDAFYADGIRQRRPECAECTKLVSKGANEAKKLAKNIGIPYVAPPGTKCQICQKMASKGNSIVFDHCHKTNTFIGYLCNTCNRGLGLLGDDEEGILRVLNYLKK